MPTERKLIKQAQEIDLEEGYKDSVEFLKQCTWEYGFVASVVEEANYRRVWSRDGMINGLAAVATGDRELLQAFRKNLETLKKFQGDYGELPSNVDPEEGDVSYGRTCGRVDATLWYVIGCFKYYKDTGDKEFLNEFKGSLERAMFVLGAWEYNQKDFVFIPDSGDWADESPRHGYILYDQLLYYKAMRLYSCLLEELGEERAGWDEKATRLWYKIQTNFWAGKGGFSEEHIYHPGMFKSYFDQYKGKQKIWLEDFHHHAIYQRFDAFANILSILFDLSNEEQINNIFNYINSKISLPVDYLMPAFYPIISPQYEEQWKKMHGSYSFYFKNKPYYAHNGGLWPMLTGFYVLALLKMGKKDLATTYLKNIYYANSVKKEKDNGWGFYEYHHGKNLIPEGTEGLAWNAAAGIIGYQALINGKQIF